ncbi:hypothetical protein BB561_003795 [Smittium simulii]|uniref:Phospholipid scramblase n=1 Tax=Smittium simulii TaxID=133385 RepID=A0A2T9YJP1_9FUNG|nr:hypothetical protein BB561_003795 [Smittium simulii]
MSLSKVNQSVEQSQINRLNSALYNPEEVDGFSGPENYPINTHYYPQNQINYEHPILSKSVWVISNRVTNVNFHVSVNYITKYKIMDTNGVTIGYIAKEILTKQSIIADLTSVSDTFSFVVFDLHKNPVLKITKKRNTLKSQFLVANGLGEAIGECHHKFNLTHRKYDLMTKSGSFAITYRPPLSRTFPVKNQNDQTVATIKKEFNSVPRMIFTDTRVYHVNMDPGLIPSDNLSKPISSEGNVDLSNHRISSTLLTLDERAVILANVLSIDHDYYKED